jgi:hypothetical protein
MPIGTSAGGRLRGGGAFADDNGRRVAAGNGRNVDNEGNLIPGSTSGITNNDNTEELHHIMARQNELRAVENRVLEVKK